MTKDLSVQTIYKSSDLLQVFRELGEWADELHLAYAWITSENGNSPHWQSLPLNKIKRALVGIKPCFTDPNVLRILSERNKILKLVELPNGIFHPKLILGFNKSHAWAILGSSNLTSGGFSSNTEINVLFKGNKIDEPFTKLKNFIDETWNSSNAYFPSEQNLLDYELRCSQLPRRPRNFSLRHRPNTDVQAVNQLNIPWNDYYSLIIEQDGRTLANGDIIRVFPTGTGSSYIEEVEQCQQFFRENESFQSLTLEQRKFIAGWGDETSGAFGYMKGAGRYKEITRLRPQIFSALLDNLPLLGGITLEQAQEYFHAMLQIDGVAIPTASRLIAMKRPDMFLAVNSANEVRIRSVFGYSPRNDFTNYFRLHNTIWAFPWFNVPEPEDIDERIVWRNRVALLDTIFYNA